MKISRISKQLQSLIVILALASSLGATKKKGQGKLQPGNKAGNFMDELTSNPIFAKNSKLLPYEPKTQKHKEIFHKSHAPLVRTKQMNEIGRVIAK